MSFSSSIRLSAGGDKWVAIVSMWSTSWLMDVPFGRPVCVFLCGSVRSAREWQSWSWCKDLYQKPSLVVPAAILLVFLFKEPSTHPAQSGVPQGLNIY